MELLNVYREQIILVSIGAAIYPAFKVVRYIYREVKMSIYWDISKYIGNTYYGGGSDNLTINEAVKKVIFLEDRVKRLHADIIELEKVKDDQSN